MYTEKDVANVVEKARRVVERNIAPLKNLPGEQWPFILRCEEITGIMRPDTSDYMNLKDIFERSVNKFYDEARNAARTKVLPDKPRMLSRDELAEVFLSKMIATHGGFSVEEIVELAYQYADAVIAKRAE